MKDYTDDSADYDRLCQIFEKYDIRYFFYIGGNDSMDTVAKLSVYTREKGLDVKVVGIPKTIDNDLMCIDHTPGFGSAAKFIAATVLEMAHDTYIYHIDTVLIVEIMGRNAGWLTAAAHLASETDIDESICLGKNGVKLAMEGKSGVMSTIIRDCEKPYKVHYDGADISMIANKEKTVPLEWISEDGTDVNDRMERYLRPLIQGEKKVNYVNGIPEYIMM